MHVPSTPPPPPMTSSLNPNLVLPKPTARRRLRVIRLKLVSYVGIKLEIFDKNYVDFYLFFFLFQSRCASRGSAADFFRQFAGYVWVASSSCCIILPFQIGITEIPQISRFDNIWRLSSFLKKILLNNVTGWTNSDKFQPVSFKSLELYCLVCFRFCIPENADFDPLYSL